MIEIITKYTALISAVSALISAVAVLISTGFVIWVTCFRKTRRDRIDELKVEMQILLTHNSSQVLIREQGKEGENEFFSLLDPKFQKPKYKMLHRTAYDELTYEGKNHWINLLRAVNKSLAEENKGGR